MGFGRNGDRVAKTPFLTFPPSLGGATVRDTVSFFDWENSQINQIYVNSSIPFMASGFRNSGSKMILPRSCGTRLLCLGIPNLSGKSVSIRAIVFISLSIIASNPRQIKKKCRFHGSLFPVSLLFFLSQFSAQPLGIMVFHLKVGQFSPSGAHVIHTDQAPALICALNLFPVHAQGLPAEKGPGSRVIPG